MHLHILGICGTFMAGFAILARSAGHKVTGCDAAVYPPMSTQLEEQGIELIEGYDYKQLSLKPDIYIIGNVVSRGNPLCEAILNYRLPYSSAPEWLNRHLLAQYRVCSVAGTHGKTTTSAMLAWVLERTGRSPSFLIGGIPQNFGVSARLVKSASQGDGIDVSNLPPFVIEADEYDTAFFDKRSKFVHYRSQIAILNNLEFDHADIFPDIEAIETQFHHLIRTVPSLGLLVVNGDETALKRVLQRGCWSQKVFFGGSKNIEMVNNSTNDWTIDDEAEVFHKGLSVGQLTWELTGRHNELNALAVIAAASYFGVAAKDSLRALTDFVSVKRRMEKKADVNGIVVYDDFAHHPTAIATTLAGVRKKIMQADNRLIVVLEPRSNTMKLGHMKAKLADSLSDADIVFGYAETSGKNALGWDLLEALAPLNLSKSMNNQSLDNRVYCFEGLNELALSVAKIAQPNDIIICMSNGSFGNMPLRIADELQKRWV